MMKRAWAAQIEVLQIVIDVCKNHNLQYFADWGTLLGAVRHNGFIPWDDDIDICFKRDDYNKLISILKDELPKGFAIMGMFADTEEMRLAAEVTHLRVVADDSWNFNDYMGYYKALKSVADKAGLSVVTVTAARQGVDFFNSTYQNIADEYGIVISSDSTGYYILTEYSLVKNSENIQVTYCLLYTSPSPRD